MLFKMNDEYWTNANGDQILIADMSEAYAKNVLRLIIRRQRESNSEPESEQTGIASFEAGEFYK